MGSDEKKDGKKTEGLPAPGTPPANGAELVEISTWLPQAMEPGVVFLLQNRLQLRQENGPHSFWAILACPQCGTLGLITEPQFLGKDSVVCGSALCSSHFFISDRARFDYLPAH